MDFFYDCEFLDTGSTIELISLGMVAADGREFYGVRHDAPWHRIVEHDWLMANVVPSLPISLTPHPESNSFDIAIRREHPDVKAITDRAGIAAGVLDLIGNDPFPRLWAYYAAYDHVVLAQLWGRMLDLPSNMPMWTHDLKQEQELRGNPQLPKQAEGHHNALADARWNREAYLWLQQQPTVAEQ